MAGDYESQYGSGGRGAQFTRFVGSALKRVGGAITGKKAPIASGGGSLSGLKESEGSRASGPAHGSYDHNSPAKLSIYTGMKRRCR